MFQQQKPFLTAIFAAGNVLPLDRTGSMEQPMFRIFQQKLASGAWCHIFPEGRVWQNWRFQDRAGAVLDEPVLGEFKLGVGKLVAHSWPNVPLVLPMYHKGMSGVIPEKVISSQQMPAKTGDSAMHKCSKKRRKHRSSVPQSLFPRGGNTIHCYFGEPLDFTAQVATFECSHPGELAHWNTTLDKLALYERITMQIRAAVLQLEAEAYNRTLPINPIPIDTHPESAVLRSYSEDSAIHVGSIEEEQSVLQ
jgi:monolysocardiolipin acyltransferase